MRKQNDGQTGVHKSSPVRSKWMTYWPMQPHTCLRGNEIKGIETESLLLNIELTPNLCHTLNVKVQKLKD